MCGIFAYLGNRHDAYNLVFQGLKQLEYRGYDSWGTAWSSNLRKEQFSFEKHPGRINPHLLPKNHPSSLALGHTRWATHGGATTQNAHPHLTTSRQIALVHNGIIENNQILKNELINKGYRYASQTDSETALHLLEEYLKNHDFLHACNLVFNQVTGLNAFVIANHATQEIIASSHGSPLVFCQTPEGIFIASDAVALSQHCQRAYFLRGGDLLHLTPQHFKLYSGSSLTPKLPTWKKLDFSVSDTSRQQYSSFLEKEIHEQPTIIRRYAHQSFPSIKNLASKLSSPITLLGCGTSYHAALLGTYFFSHIARHRSRAIIGSEFSSWKHEFNQTDCLILLSQSGETIDLVEHLTYLIDSHIPFASIINRVGSTLDQASPAKILLEIGPEQSVLATKSYLAQLCVLFLLANQLNGTTAQAKAILNQASQACLKVIHPDFVQSYISPVAQHLKSRQHLYILGKGLAYPLALEAALKIKESTYIHAEAFAAGEFKHGPLALITSSSPCLVFAFKDNQSATVISNAIEAKTRGATIIGVGNQSNPVFDYFIPVDDLDLLTVFPSIICLQLLTLQLTKLLGNDPDKPKNLAKSVTVK